MPSKYNLRAVEAEQLTFDPSKEEGQRTNAEQLAEWCGGEATMVGDPQVPQVVLTNTRQGTRVANVGDYVVQLNPGNFTVLSERDFEEQYDTSKKK